MPQPPDPYALEVLNGEDPRSRTDYVVRVSDVDSGQLVMSDEDNRDEFVQLLWKLRQEHENVVRDLKEQLAVAQPSSFSQRQSPEKVHRLDPHPTAERTNGQLNAPLSMVEIEPEKTRPLDDIEVVKDMSGVLFSEFSRATVGTSRSGAPDMWGGAYSSFTGETIAFELARMWSKMIDKRPSERWEHWLHEEGVDLHLGDMNVFRYGTEKGIRSRTPSGYHGVTARVLHRGMQKSTLEDIYSSCLMRCVVISPVAKKRVFWDVIGMLLLAYDLISIPLYLAFDPEKTALMEVLGWVTLIFWTLDIFVSLNTGYYRVGRLVMERSDITRHYLKGWFWLDLLVVVPDWVQKVLFGNLTPASGLGRAMRAVRIVRALRLLRLLKLGSMLSRIYDLIDSEYHFIWFNLLKMIIMILFLNHLVACGFYAIGKYTKDQRYPKNWLEDVGLAPVWDEPFGWKYITSLHWAITQFTPASMDVSATNALERVFSVIVLFWALVVLSSLIGSVSASMTALRSLSSDSMTKFWVLRRFLRQQKISKPLTDRILKYLEYKQMSIMNMIRPAQVVLLRELSEPLRMHMEGEIVTPVLNNHPFFNFLIGETPVVMYRLSYYALKVTPHAYDDCVYHPGDSGTRMYFVKSGSFKYKLINNVALSQALEAFSWVSEATLWTTWRHRGYFIARQPGETIDVTPQNFCDGLHQHPNALRLAKLYGRKFVEHLNGLPLNEICDVMFDKLMWEGFVNSAKLRVAPTGSVLPSEVDLVGLDVDS